MPVNSLSNHYWAENSKHVWSPDGQYLAYVHRQNPDSAPADHLAGALHSNLYRVEAATGQVTPLTAFAESLVYDDAWSSDGQRLAFTANDAIWLIEPGQPAEQVSPPGVVARHPDYLPDPGGQNGG